VDKYPNERICCISRGLGRKNAFQGALRAWLFGDHSCLCLTGVRGQGSDWPSRRCTGWCLQRLVPGDASSGRARATSHGRYRRRVYIGRMQSLNGSASRCVSAAFMRRCCTHNSGLCHGACPTRHAAPPCIVTVRSLSALATGCHGIPGASFFRLGPA